MSKPQTKQRSIPVIMAVILTAALTSCVTKPPFVVKVDIPVVAWPAFPDPTGQVTRVDNIVSMPLAYWLSMTRYVIDVEAGIAEIEAARGVYAEQ